MALTPPPPAPNTSDPTSFASRADAHVAWQATNVDEMNAFQANLNSIAAGGAYAIPYSWNTQSNIGGGSGNAAVASGSASQSAASTIFLDVLGSNTKDYTSILGLFDDSTSTVKGDIRIEKQGASGTFLTFAITSMTTATGYRSLSVVNTGGSSANPFTTGDAVLLYFTRNGDKGTTGATGANGATNLLGTATVSTAVANIDFLTLFSDTYDKYTIDVEGVIPSAADVFCMRVANGGAVVNSTASYRNMAAHNASYVTNNQLNLGNTIQAGSNSGGTFTIEVRNARSTMIKSIGARGTAEGTAFIAEGGTNILGAGTAVSGFRLFWGSGANFTAGTVRVYGHVNT